MTIRSVGLAACALAILLLAIALISGRMAYSAPASHLAAGDAWVRLPAVPGRPAAGYLTVRGGDTGEALVAVSSPDADKVEMHRTEMDGGTMRMMKVDTLPLDSSGTLKLAPGGTHLMLFGLKAEPGKTVPIYLKFASGKKLHAEAKAQSAGDAAPVLANSPPAFADGSAHQHN